MAEAVDLETGGEHRTHGKATQADAQMGRWADGWVRVGKRKNDDMPTSTYNLARSRERMLREQLTQSGTSPRKPVLKDHRKQLGQNV